MHKRALADFGGEYGVYKHTDASIESVLAQQYPIFEYDKYPSLFQKAAMLLYFFTKGHCFVDGNKRVGIQSAIVFLDINGYNDYLIDDEGYEKTLEIESRKLSELQRDDYINEIADWLAARFKKRRRIIIKRKKP